MSDASLTSVDIELPNEQASEAVATQLAHHLTAPLILTFSGEIGAGKTTIIRAMLRALGVTSAIKSPTFSLVETYLIEKMTVHHFDLYRIHDESELEMMGFRDYFTVDAVCCIEWPERVSNRVILADIAFSLRFSGAGRTLHASALSALGASQLACCFGAP